MQLCCVLAALEARNAQEDGRRLLHVWNSVRVLIHLQQRSYSRGEGVLHRKGYQQFGCQVEFGQVHPEYGMLSLYC